MLIIIFLFPLFGSLLPEPLRVLRCKKGCRRSHSRCFFRRITLARKEEFAGNALQNGGNRHGSLHSHRQNLRRWRHGRREKKGSETVERDDGVANRNGVDGIYKSDNGRAGQTTVCRANTKGTLSALREPEARRMAQSGMCHRLPMTQSARNGKIRMKGAMRQSNDRQDASSSGIPCCFNCR